MNSINSAYNIVSKRESVIAAYGYGSGFFHQLGYDENVDKSLDFIFVVDDIRKWHEKNYKLIKDDYSFYSNKILTKFPKKILKGKTNIVYNLGLSYNDEKFKYGIIEKQDIIKSLITWDNFYICGRMQKPLFVIKQDNDIKNSIEHNRNLALIVSLMILNKEFLNIDDLLYQICKLSYYGDFRNLFIENPNKVRNIVIGSKQELIKIYNNPRYLKIEGDIANINLSNVYSDYYLLPSNLKKNIDGKYLKRQITLNNLIESLEQPIKSFIINGPKISIEYMNEKIKKKALK